MVTICVRNFTVHMLKPNYSLVTISTAIETVYKIQNFLYSIDHTENCLKNADINNICNFSYANLMYEDLFKDNLCYILSQRKAGAVLDKLKIAS